ncbi:hypothetical protein CGRA01v4_12282 [Colletotrichum graminicola]|nr:hypothetical protein CGRA01v4_12282 [Colletotrichum graminicola]
MLNAHARLRTPTRAVAERMGERKWWDSCIVFGNEQPSDDAGCLKHAFLGFAALFACSPQHKVRRRSGFPAGIPTIRIPTASLPDDGGQTGCGTGKDPHYPQAEIPPQPACEARRSSDRCLSGRRPNHPPPRSSLSPPSSTYHGEAQSELGIIHPPPSGGGGTMTPNGGPCTPRSTRSYQLRHVLRTEAERPWGLMRASLLFLSFLHWGYVEPHSMGELPLRSERTGPRQSAETRWGRGCSLKRRYESDDTLAWPCYLLNPKPHNLSRLTTASRTAYPRECSTFHRRVKRLFSLLFPFSVGGQWKRHGQQWRALLARGALPPNLLARHAIKKTRTKPTPPPPPPCRSRS